LPEKSLPTSLGINIQGIETRGFIGRLPELKIGDIEIDDLLVAYVSEEHSDHMFSEAMIGLGLLSRFNLVFDYDRRKLYIEPNKMFNEPFEYNMSGLTLRPGHGEYLDIIRVRSDSPGDEAGLKEGDRITHINGKSTIEIDFFELRSLLKQSGNAVNLKIQRNGEQSEVSLLLRRII
jgi:C-terminal processing protease CtpA/Prc